MIQNDSFTKGECLSSASSCTATVMPDNYCEFQTEQRRRMTSPGVSGCEWVVKILRYSVAIPRCSRQSEQTWKARAYKHFLDACIIQVKTRRRVSSVIYHIHEVKKKKLKMNVPRAKLPVCSIVIALLWAKENIQ